MSRTVLTLVLAAATGSAGPALAQEAVPNRRAVTVVARDGKFAPETIEVARNDLVTVTLRSEDGPYSFAIDAYRLMKRTGAGQSVTFQFRADRAGRFLYYCNLSSEERCRDMKGTLIVEER
jgi:heme/copper-type cytochrome/quinol oxidase subunit 2